MKYVLGHAVLRPELAVEVVTTPKRRTCGVPLMSLHWDAKREGWFLVELNPERVVFIPTAERLMAKADDPLTPTPTQSKPADLSLTPYQMETL